MPTVPYTGETSVAPNFAPTPSTQIEGIQAASGYDVATAKAGLGREVSKASDELFARAYAMQQLDQQSKATMASADASDKISDEFAKFTSLQGRAAMDALPDFKQKVKDISDQVGSGLDSDYAKKLYMNETRSVQSRTYFSAAKHAGDQFKSYQIGTAQAGVDSAINAVGVNPASEDAFQAALAKTKEQTPFMQTSHGWSDEQTKVWVDKNNSQAVFQRATSMALTDPIQAEKFLKTAGDQGLITSDELGKAARYVRSQKLNVSTRVESSKFMGGETAAFGEGKIPVDRLVEAIAGVESSNNYSTVGPTSTNKQGQTGQPLGRLGVMSYNLSPWLKEAGMPDMTPQQFLDDHAAQDKLGAFKLGQYQDKYGSANEAASHWRGLGDKDVVFGETKAQYLAKLNKNLAKSSTGSEIRDLSTKTASAIAPDDSEFEETFTNRNLTEHSRQLATDREDEFNRKQTLAEALAPAKDGKLPTSIEEFTPEQQEAYNNAQPSTQSSVNKALAQNAKGDYAQTPENQAAFQKWYGRMINPERTPEDTQDILNHDFSAERMPWDQRRQLMERQKGVFKNATAPPEVGHAINVLKPLMQSAGIRSSNKDDYNNFIGSLALSMQERQVDQPGKKLTDDDIRSIGGGLLRQQSSGWFPWSKDASYRVPMPDKERDAFVQQFTESQGREPSDSEIQTAYAAKMYREFYQKQKSQSTVPVSR